MSNELNVQAITSLDPNTLNATDVNRFPQTIGLQYNVPPDDMNFDGSSDAVSMNGTDPLNVAGAFTVVATFKADLTERKGYYYLWSHNNQDALNEKFFRFRLVKDVLQIQFGVWNNYENHMVDIPLPAGIDGKWVTLTGIFNPPTPTPPRTPPPTTRITFKLFNGSTLIGSNNDETPKDPGAFEGTWFIGAHAPEIEGKQRYFKGILPRVTLFPTALQLWVTLSNDSDNNGYNSSVTKNSPAEYLERSYRNDVAKAKPLTYFDNTRVPDDIIVPVDYKRLPLRIFAFTDDAETTRFIFEVDSGLKIVDSNGDDVVVLDGAFSDLNLSTIDDDGNITDNYFVEATAIPSPNPTPKTVTLRLVNANDSVVGDSVTFSVQEAHAMYDWIVPSGWKINDGNSFTTPVSPYDLSTKFTDKLLVGPQFEGSGVTTNRGCVFSTGKFIHGFRIKLNFSFLKNTTGAYPPQPATGTQYPLGYIRPDAKTRNEKYDDPPASTKPDLQQLDFVGNSGIKFFTDSGHEILIFDTQALTDAINGFGVVKEDVDHTNDSDPDKEPGWIYKENKKYFIKDKISFARVKADNVISGNLYNKDNAPEEGWDGVNAASTRQTANNTLEVEVRSLGAGAWNVISKVNGVTIVSKENLMITVNNGIVYLQAHWGSGVTLSNIVIVSLPEDLQKNS
jgi:hypothetical protein